jgi:hypothetical protein
MFRKILLFGLPIYLYGLELLLKAVASVRADSVAGPTLAGAGMGFLLPLTDLKEVPLDPQLKAALAPGTKAYSTKDKRLTDFVWITFFVSLGAWMYCVFLTIQNLHLSFGGRGNVPLIIGCLIFGVSIVLAEIKERL